MSKISRKKYWDNKVLDALIKRRLNTFDIRKLGPSHPAGVIQRLREEWNISKTLVTAKDSNGVTHKRVALYKFEGFKKDMNYECL